jgi:hypothetical protein
MAQYKIIRVYRVEAESRQHAKGVLLKAEAAGLEKKYLDGEYVREVEPSGWIALIRKQLLGS